MPDIFKKIVQEVSRNETFEQLLRRIGFGQEFIDPYVNGLPFDESVEQIINNTVTPGAVTATFVIAPTGTTANYNTDGTADQTEINQAIADLPANGGRIILREGTYTLSGPIIINKSNVILEGQGDGTKITL